MKVCGMNFEGVSRLFIVKNEECLSFDEGEREDVADLRAKVCLGLETGMPASSTVGFYREHTRSAKRP